ncbi:MAG: hypothetical protein ACTHM1_01125 [Solirubrobacteraceae bacterium]
MKVTARIWWIAPVVWLTVVLAAPAAHAAEFGVKTFEAGTCNTDTPECSYESPESQFYTQAAGHPPLGLTGFELNTEPSGAPIGQIKDVRVDVPPGLSVNPQAAEQCKKETLEKTGTCPPGSEVGEDEITAFVGLTKIGPVSLHMYNLVPEEGVPAEFGFALNVASVINVDVFIVGGISWHHEEPSSENSGVPTGDYHEFFTIKEISNQLEIVKSRLKFNGRAGNGSFLTLPSTCTTQKSYLHVDSYQNPGQFKAYETVSGEPKPVSVSGCNQVPFEPEIAVKPATSQSDQPDGATIEVKVPQHLNAEEIDSSTLKDAHVTLPAGMTLNPSAVNGLQACTDEQLGKGSAKPVECPAGSQIGTVTIETPNLPAGSLVGNVYVGQPLAPEPESKTPYSESEREYRIFIDAESPRYGVAVRLVGNVIANASTGQLTTAVLENPPVPFSDFIVSLNGPHVPLANPLACGEAAASAILTPYTGGASANPLSSFSVDFDGKGGACPSTLPFALTQSAHSEPSTGGHTTSFTLSLARSDGNQYVGKTSTTLPAGLVAKVPNVQQCSEADANAGKCPQASKIGVVSAAVGAGPNPLVLPGTVYFTGPYAGAPFGLLVAVPAEKVGPFNYGTIVTRATVNIDPYTARVVVGATLPTIVGGAPIRLKSLTVTVNRPDFTLNPTNCGGLATESLLTSTFGSTQLVSSPFQASGCSSLAFKPTFAAKTNAKASRRNGASFEVSVGYPASSQANLKSVFVQLPKQLPSRLSTLNKACPEATFKANPATCPTASAVGAASATTPVLPGTLSGPAYFVSHGGASFPDLDIDLSGDGVKVILVGATNITTGITTSTFASIPDVPVSSFHLKLPAGPFSALAARGNLCGAPLVMPTTLTAQNGAVVKQNTRISVAGCKHPRAGARVRILSHRVRGHKVVLTLRVPSAGRLTVGGRDLRTVRRALGKARRITVSVPLSRAGLRALAQAHRHHRHLRLRVRVRFVPRKGHASFASVTVRFG